MVLSRSVNGFAYHGNPENAIPVVNYLKRSDSSDSSDSGPDSSDSCTKAGLSHLQDALHDTTTSRDTPCMHQDPISCSILAQALDSCSTALSSEGEMSQGAVVQSLQTQISPFQSTLRAKYRVERCTKRIAYLFSPHSASLRG